MEIAMGKEQLFKFGIPLVVLTLVSYSLIYLFATPIKKDLESAEFKSQEKKSSIKIQAQKTKASLAKLEIRQENNHNQMPTPSEEASVSKIDARAFEKLKKSYLEKLSGSQQEYAQILDEVNKEFEKLKKISQTNSFKLSKLDSLQPSVRYYLATFLDIKGKDLVEQDLDRVNFTDENWYYISRFTQHNDFKLLLGQNRVSKDEFHPVRLKSLYQTNADIRYQKIKEKYQIDNQIDDQIDDQEKSKRLVLDDEMF
jgi:hypothetical protein